MKSINVKGLYYEKFGHIVAIMFYIIPILSIILNFLITTYASTIILFVVIFVTICALISTILRIKFILK